MATPTPSAECLEVVRWAASLGAVTARAVAVIQNSGPARARGQLQAGCRAGLLAAARPLGREPTLYCATAAGRRIAGGAMEGCRVAPSNAAHLIATADVAAAMTQRHPDHSVQGERELRAHERAAGHALASAWLGTASDGSPRLHRPDLVLWPAGGASLPVAVEVELTVKAPARLRAIVLGWARCRRVAGTLYCVHPAARRAVERAVAQTAAQERVLVIALAAVTPAPADTHAQSR